MNLVSMAAVVMAVAEPELKWLSLGLRLRWAAVLAALAAGVLVLLLPLAAVEDQGQALVKGLALLRSKLGLGHPEHPRPAGPNTGLSVTSGELQLLVLKPKDVEWVMGALCAKFGTDSSLVGVAVVSGRK
uniref:Uncharacterized protein n=1 Tax=Anolis carolinensis TaxID=28377 RepID=A0A803TBC7_ANOCA